MEAMKQLSSGGLCAAPGGFGQWMQSCRKHSSKSMFFLCVVHVQPHLGHQNLYFCSQVEISLSTEKNSLKKMQYVVRKEDVAVWLQNCLCEVWEELKKPLSALEQSS